ncbi:MAG: BglII/BstYI family type II restriction endonuclease, partial [Beijerinckiaceae bacterium]
MSNQNLVPDDIRDRFDVHDWRNGLAILSSVYTQEWQDILAVLRGFRLLRSDIIKPGKNKSDIAAKIDGHLTELGWVEKSFDTRIVVDEKEYRTPTHSVDCYKNRVALEVEW